MDHSPVSPSSYQEGANDNIEAVRDLLFGKKTAEISGRLELTEHSLRDAIARMEERINGKIRVLEGLLSDQLASSEARISSVDNRLKVESEARVKQGGYFSRNLEQFEASMNEKINAQEDRVLRFESKIWNELHTRTKKQTDELTSLINELLNRIEAELTSLGRKSADRKEIGDLLIDMGLKIQTDKDSHKTPKRSVVEAQTELPA